MKAYGLALGGGAVLGAAHVGVLQAAEELAIPVEFVSGTSIGAFIGALYAFGKSPLEIREVALDLDWLNLSGISLSQYGLLSNRKFGGIVTDLLGRKNIEDAIVPLAIVATDISTGDKVVFTEGDVASAVMASSCIPGVFRPVEYNGRMLVDGVLVENVPVSSVRSIGARKAICVDLLGKHVFRQPQHIVAVLLNAFYSAIASATAVQIEDADLCITPDLSAFNLVDTAQVPDIIKAGYDAALPLLRTLCR
ncbi:MAG: patatin-like phospholipase family protein [Chlorobium sp.]|uniref:patatin-like phospholipase family protein n=1 Tax=Chlorobium sp. TaxID=1095 RepID=UPI002F3E5FD4